MSEVRLIEDVGGNDGQKEASRGKRKEESEKRKEKGREEEKQIAEECSSVRVCVCRRAERKRSAIRDRQH